MNKITAAGNCRAGSPDPAIVRPPAGSAFPPYSKTGRAGWPRLLITGGLAVLMPKCLACVAGYLALGVGFAAKAPELCGAVADGAAGSQWRFMAAAIVLAGGACWLMTRPRSAVELENTKKPSR